MSSMSIVIIRVISDNTDVFILLMHYYLALNMTTTEPFREHVKRAHFQAIQLYVPIPDPPHPPILYDEVHEATMLMSNCYGHPS